MYKVTVAKNFKYNQRVRAGVVVSREYGYVGELTDEQLSAIEADEQLFVEIKGDEPTAKEASNEIPQDAEAEALSEADDEQLLAEEIKGAEPVSETALDEVQQDVETEDSSESGEQDEPKEAPKDGASAEKSGKKNRVKKDAVAETISQ